MIDEENIYNEILKDSLSNSPLALVFWVVDEDNISVIDWNSVSERIFGWTKEEVIGRNFFDFFIPESEKISIENVVKMLMEKRYPDININKNLTKNGGERLIKWFNTPTKDLHNNRFFVVSLGEDITELEIIKQKVEEGERRFHLLFDKMQSGFAYHEIILDSKGEAIDYKFLEVNPEFERLTGLKAKEIIGKTVKEVIPNIEKMWIEKYGKVALTGESIEFESYSNRFNRYYNVRAYSPEKYKFATIFNDITEIKTAQEEINKQKQFYESIIEKIQESLIVCDKDDIIYYVNNSFLAFSGVDAQVVVGKNIITDFTWLLPDTFFRDYKKAKEEKEAIKSERHSIILPSKRFAYMSGWIVPTVVNEKLESMIITFEDVTEKIISELEIKRLNRVYSVLSNTNQAIVREKQIDRLFDEICKIVTEDGEFSLSCIGFKDELNNGIILKSVNSKFQIDRKAGDIISLNEIPKNWENVLKEGIPYINNDIEADETYSSIFFKSRLSLCSSLATYPLKFKDKIIGFIEIFSDEIGFFDYEEQKLLAELASDLSFAIEYYEIDQERLAVENRIRNLNRKLETILQNSPAGIISLTVEGLILSWNKASELILGWKEEEAVGQNIFDVYPEYKDTINLLKDTLLKGKRIYNYELLLTRKGGSPITISVSAAPVLNEAGQAEAIITVIYDITEQRLSEEALLESERRFEELLRNLNLIALVLDINGKIMFCNDFLLRLTGWTREEIIGKSWFEYFLPDDVRVILESRFSDFIIKKELPLHYENHILTKEGEKLLINWNNTYYTNDLGQVIGTLSIGEDITVKRAAEEEMKKLNTMLEQKVYEKTRELERALVELKYENEERKRTAEILKITSQDLAKSLEKERELNELKSKFVDMVIHQYRTPLSIILSSATLALNYAQSMDFEKLKKYITSIKSSAKEMLRLLEDVLIIGEAQTDKMLPKLEHIDLKELYYEIIEALPAYEEKTHNFLFSTVGENFNINSDRNYVTQIITHLLTNAINYSEMSRTIRTKIMDLGQNIEISVEDEGIGISAEEQKHLFDAFYRGKSAKGTFGSGLGLPIVKKLLDLLGGTIEIKSKVGVGSIFIVKIPKNK